MSRLQEAYRNYTETKEIWNDDGTMSAISPIGHYTGESIEDFKNKLLTDDEFNEQWNNGCTKELDDDERIDLSTATNEGKKNMHEDIRCYAPLSARDEVMSLLDEHNVPKRKIID